MGLISKEAEIVLNSRNIKHYEDLGYKIPRYIDRIGRSVVKRGTRIIVKIEDLVNTSIATVKVKCDACGEILENVLWLNYKLNVHEDGTYYCQKCSVKLAKNKAIKTIITRGKSFEQWCIENNRQDILDRWDYNLNLINPNEVSYSSMGFNKKGYYFKCPRGIHKSELKRISDLVNNKGNFSCNQCNSFAQWGIDNIDEDFLEKYWDYDKNKVSPWETPCKTNGKKVWIKCQEKDYHGSYEIYCCHFTSGVRCGYCGNRKVHPLDSLGTLYPQVLEVWSDKNKKSPYEYAPMSNKKVWWKCPDGKHKDFKRKIASSNIYKFRCAECQFSEGEKVIEEYLMSNNIKYIPQKEFEGLVGLGGGNLSYDFYLPDYNLLIEFQGIQHEKPIDFKGKGKEYAEKQFIIQKTHDNLKYNYAKSNIINFLEIWYYDFEKIKEILYKYLNKLNTRKSA
jgi:hypothetical protein